MWALSIFVFLLILPLAASQECRTSLGMQNRQIPDSRITASSQWDQNHGAANGRLGNTAGGGKTGAWSSRYNDIGQWLQVDFGHTVKVTAIQTQGRKEHYQWVTSYTLSTSQNNGLYEPYRQNGQIKVFSANKDRDTVVTQSVSPPIVARYVRIHPRTWRSHISMRVEFLGCKSDSAENPDCMEALGLQSNTIPDASMSASSEYNYRHKAANARLHFQAGGGRTGAWSSKSNNVDQWLLVDLGKAAKIRGVATQGRMDYNQWVRSYTLFYGSDGVFLNQYKQGGAQKVFQGNSDRYTVVSHIIDPPIIARFVRINPKSWYGHISMRAELYGCKAGFTPPDVGCILPLGLESGKIPDGSISATSSWDANHGPARSRLRTVRQGSAAAAWCTTNRDPDQWIQVDFKKNVMITRIATQGRQDSDLWVSSYTLSSSLDGGRFRPYENNKVFQGNRDRNTVVGIILPEPITARYIRLHPKTWNRLICIRWELFGCREGFPKPKPPQCEAPLGLQNKQIPDAAMIASSELSSYYAASNGRLYFQGGYASGSWKASVWTSKINDPWEWLQVDLGDATQITGVATQGRRDYNQWVKTYVLRYASDRCSFVYYRPVDKVKTFAGNTDRNTVVYHDIDPSFIARSVRFHPKSWYGRISMRAELYGCKQPVEADSP